MIVISLLIIFAVIGIITVSRTKFDNPVVEIRKDGELLERVPLNLVQHERLLDLDGSLRIQIRNGEVGEVGVVYSDCHGQDCVKAGFVSGALPLVCLPNRVEVRIVNHNSDLHGITK